MDSPGSLKWRGRLNHGDRFRQVPSAGGFRPSRGERRAETARRRLLSSVQEAAVQQGSSDPPKIALGQRPFADPDDQETVPDGVYAPPVGSIQALWPLYLSRFFVAALHLLEEPPIDATKLARERFLAHEPGSFSFGRTHRHYSVPMPFLWPNSTCCGCSDFAVGPAASGSGDVGRLPQPPAEIRTISSAVTGASTREMALGFIGRSRCG